MISDATDELFVAMSEDKRSKQEKLNDALFNATGTGNLELVKQGIKAGGDPTVKQSGKHFFFKLCSAKCAFILM